MSVLFCQGRRDFFPPDGRPSVAGMRLSHLDSTFRKGSGRVPWWCRSRRRARWPPVCPSGFGEEVIHK